MQKNRQVSQLVTSAQCLKWRNRMFNIAICDDDLNIVRQMKNLIESYEKEKCSVSTYSSGEELLKARENFDVIFLDIDMSGIDGIETARQIRNTDKDVKVIYLTSFTDYVNLAFSVHAFGYLNKPIKKEEIYKQLDEAIIYARPKENEKLIEFITTDGIKRLAPKEIYFFEYLNRNVQMKTLTDTYILKQKITDVSKFMNQYEFLMPHKSFTVNLFYVKSVKGYDIYMMDGSIIPLSQKKSVEFKEQLNIFLGNHI